RQARLTYFAVLHIERRGGRDDREGVGRALAQLEIARVPGKGGGLAGKAQRRDQVARFERGLALRRVAGQSVQRLERYLPPPALAFDLDNGIERDQGHAEV